jgi:hypothetical protein
MKVASSQQQLSKGRLYCITDDLMIMGTVAQWKEHRSTCDDGGSTPPGSHLLADIDNERNNVSS